MKLKHLILLALLSIFPLHAQEPELANTQDVAAAQAASARAIEIKTANFTAVVGGRYILESAGTITVTNPTGTTQGQSFECWIGSGSAVINGATFAASRFSIRTRYTGAAWVNPSPVISDTLTVGSGTWSGSIFTGPQAFSSTTRPTSAGTGTPDATSMVTRADVDSWMLVNLLKRVTPNWAAPTSVAANGGTWDASGALVRSRSGTSGNGANSIYKSFSLSTGASSNGGINFALPVEFHTSWNLGSGGRLAESKHYLAFGRTHNAGSPPAPMTSPDKHTIGLLIDSGVVYLIAHNGTSLTTSSALWTITDAGQTYHTRIRSDGSGNVSLFVDFSASATATITGGPTATSGGGWVVFSTQQTTANNPTTQALLLVNNCHVILNP